MTADATEPAQPFADTIRQIRAAIDEPCESIKMTVDQHPIETMGDPTAEGTAAWHLRHSAEVFRTHAHHLIGPETDAWPPVPTAATEATNRRERPLLNRRCKAVCLAICVASTGASTVGSSFRLA